MKQVFLLLLCVGACMGIANAAPIVLTLTEVSSTELDYSWSDGSGSGQLFAAPGSPDNWSGAIKGPNLGGGFGVQGIGNRWKEPESEGTYYNQVFVNTDRKGKWNVEKFVSDVAGEGVVSNGATADVTPTDWLLKVVDQGDLNSSVALPEAGSTALLLGIALTGSVGVRRRLAIRSF
jgi:hypothetical protein